jgi:hypothetical protein
MFLDEMNLIAFSSGDGKYLGVSVLNMGNAEERERRVCGVKKLQQVSQINGAFAMEDFGFTTQEYFIGDTKYVCLSMRVGELTVAKILHNLSYASWAYQKIWRHLLVSGIFTRILECDFPDNGLIYSREFIREIVCPPGGIILKTRLRNNVGIIELIAKMHGSECIRTNTGCNFFTPAESSIGTPANITDIANMTYATSAQVSANMMKDLLEL